MLITFKSIRPQIIFHVTSFDLQFSSNLYIDIDIYKSMYIYILFCIFLMRIVVSEDISFSVYRAVVP